MGRLMERQTSASNTTSASSAPTSMKSPTPEVDQNGPELEATSATPSVPTPSVPTPSVPTPSVPDSNGDASPPPRLASITGLIFNQKPHQWNSTSGDPATPKSPSTTDSDQAPPSFTQLRSVRFDDDDGRPRRTASFGSTVASTLNSHRRAAAAMAAGGLGAGSASLTESDLRRFVFHHPRAKRLVSGLRVHAFTRQAFVSSFTVGLAIGSIVAIVLKILKDLAGYS